MAEYEDLFTGDLDEGWDTARQATDDSFDSLMDKMEEEYQPAEQADLLSQNLDKLLNPDSDYMLAAQERSRKAREERGYADSGFNKGIGTVEAIDNAFDTAIEDTYVDMFNVGQENAKYRTEYAGAYEAALTAMMQQNDYTSSAFDAMIEENKAEAAHQHLLERKEKLFDYESTLQDDRHDNNMQRLHLKHANDLANRIIRNKAGLQDYYLASYAGILNSDIAQESKYDLLVGLGDTIDSATREAVDKQTMKVGDNPYGISFIDYLGKYDQGSRTDEAFVWSTADALKEYENFKEVFDPIYYDIHQQTTHQERDASSLWYVFNDQLGTEMRTMDKNSDLFKNKMEFFRENKVARLGHDPSNQEIEDFFREMYRLTDPHADPLFEQKVDLPDKICIEDTADCYQPPGEADYLYWDDQNNVVKTGVTQVDGDARYWEITYKAYDDCLLDGIGLCGPAPDGYQPPNIRCPWPMEVGRDGTCIDSGDL